MGTGSLQILLATVILSIIMKTSGERILFLLPLSTNSHKIFFHPLIAALADKGHEVTVLTNGALKSPVGNENLKTLIALSTEELMLGYPEPFSSRMNDSRRKMVFPFNFVIEGCHKTIQSQAFRGILKQINNFDLILVDSFLSGCLDGFIYKSGVPFILVTTMPAPSYISERVGNFLPPSIIPVLSFRGYGELNGEMGFWSRTINLFHFLLARIYVNFVILPSLERVYKEYLGDDIPGILEIESKASLIFMNSHFTMNFPRPLLPAVVEIGGIHCKNDKSSSMDSDLENFISKSASPHGFIYFSVGSIIDLNNAPDDFIHSLLSAFSSLQQRVVVKWRKEEKIRTNMTREIKIPDNVWIDEWFSQQELLSHENIKLFISHGGLLSMQEAVYHSVPVLGIPFGIDQDTNIYNAVLQGYAVKLEINAVNEASLTYSINQVLNNSSYYENVKRISALFRHRPVSPLETALYWTEYVISTHKNNSAHYIHSPARNLTYFQYYSYDIIAFLIGSGIMLFVLMKIVKRQSTALAYILVFIAKKRNERNEVDKKLK